MILQKVLILPLILSIVLGDKISAKSSTQFKDTYETCQRSIKTAGSYKPDLENMNSSHEGLDLSILHCQEFLSTYDEANKNIPLSQNNEIQNKLILTHRTLAFLHKRTVESIALHDKVNDLEQEVYKLHKQLKNYQQDL